MAILNTSPSNSASTPAPAPPPPRSGLFIRTLIPSSTTISISLSLFPLHAISRQSSRSHLSSSRQLVTVHPSHLSVYSLHDETQMLHLISKTPLYCSVVALASLPSPIPSRDVLLALTSSAKLLFLRFDDPSNSLAVAGEVSLSSSSHLIATHPAKPLVAVPNLSNSITVFPFLFLPKSLAAGKLSKITLPALPLSLTFLHDDVDSPDAVLLVLQQHGNNQVISLFTISTTRDGLSVVKTASMIPCATRPDDIAVARAATKLTGQPPCPAPWASDVTRLEGCPYMFAVFFEGRVVAGDARSVLKGSADGNPAPVTVRLENEYEMETHAARLIGMLTDNVRMEEEISTPEGRVSDVPLFSLRRGRRYGEAAAADAEDSLSYLSIPEYITLEYGKGQEGSVIAWTDSRDHVTDEYGDGGGIYFGTAGGGMYILKWSEKIPSNGTSYRIPGGRADASTLLNFRVEHIGDLGPANTIAAMNQKLVYVAGDCSDGALLKLVPPNVPHNIAPEHVILESQETFAFQMKQEFTNLAPVTDFAIIPPNTKLHSTEDATRPSNSLPVRVFEGGGKRNCAGEVIRRNQRQELCQSNIKAENERYSVHVSKPDTGKNGEYYNRENDCALSHVLSGSVHEAEIAVCSGLGKQGSLRLIRPGAPVVIHASSGKTFMACNDMFPVRFTRDSAYQTGIALTFAQSTGILYSVPGRSSCQSKEKGTPIVAELVDGTEATGLRAHVRTLTVGAIEDGVLLQVHEKGIRVIYMKDAERMPRQRVIRNGVLADSLCERVLDWEPDNGGFISVGTIGAGYAVICVIRKGHYPPTLLLLQVCKGDSSRGLETTSSVELEREISCASIPEWTIAHASTRFDTVCYAPVVVLGTYEPCLEIRALSPSLEVISRRELCPWTLRHSNFPSPRKRSEGRGCKESRRSNSTSLGSGEDLHEGQYPSRSAAVAESICAVTLNCKRHIFVGLRDGSVVSFSFADEEMEGNVNRSFQNQWGNLLIDSHRKLGHRPVVLKIAMLSSGKIVVGQAERPWICAAVTRGNFKWLPLCFTETTAACVYSVPGAKWCLAMVGVDGALHICGINRKSEVSVRSISLGATPKRVLAARNHQDLILVAVSKEGKGRNTQRDSPSRDGDEHYNLTEANPPKTREESSSIITHLRVYNRKSQKQVVSRELLAGEQVHVLLEWHEFIVVGTSIDLQASQTTGSELMCNRGRLQLFRLEKNSVISSSSNSKTRLRLNFCCEVVLPGAVLAGATHSSGGLLVASCNEFVIAFIALRSRQLIQTWSLVEIARISTRSMVVSISIRGNIICVADRKDSIGFYSLKKGKLERDRSDYCRRSVSSVVMVRGSLAMATDRKGMFFSVGYAESDNRRSSANFGSGGRWISGIIGTRRWMRDIMDTSSLTHYWFTDMYQSATSNSGESSLVEEGLDNSVESGLGGSAGENSSQVIDSPMQGSNATGASVPDESQDNLLEPEIQSLNDGEEMNGASDGGDTMSDPMPTGEVAVVAVTGGNDAPADETVGIGEAPNFAGTVPNLPGVTVGNNPGHSWTGHRSEERDPSVPRNLACHHSFNLNDTSLRLRHGSFNRFENIFELEERQTEENRRGNTNNDFFDEATAAVFCGTLGGALVAAVPISKDVFSVLSKVESELSVIVSATGPDVDRSHKDYRSAFGSRAEGAIDGDLLDRLFSFDRASRLELCRRVGFPGEDGMLFVQGLIRDLFDRVS